MIGEGSFVDVTKIKDSASKLGAYTHLFNQRAIKEFAELSEEEEEEEKSAVEGEAKAAGSRFLDMLENLEESLVTKINELEKNEISAAWDLAAWLSDTEGELQHLDQEQSHSTNYMDKLLIAIVAAHAHEDKTWEIYFDSVQSLNNAVDNLNAVRAAYEEATAVRNEENDILDQVIQMFIEQVHLLTPDSDFIMDII